ncbi:MAG: DUF3048 domain-containing protein [Candidatus Magasanikbacteria bacterium]|nr:DUF3048 domain-containing protein [Candidatus Magasanikbacteria bacterium]
MLKKLPRKQSNETRLLYLLAWLVFLVALGLLGWFGYGYLLNRNQADFNNTVEGDDFAQSGTDCQYRRVLDGICVASEEEINPKLVAVMVENHVDARPLSGLAEASVVYEAPVEANYTRFLAIYPANVKVDKIGPVRSARPYYLDWLSEYGDAMYMHVGGSPEAIVLIKEYKLFDLNEFYFGRYYWRAPDRSAPHYIYTSSELWSRALDDYSDEDLVANYEGWAFSTSSPFGSAQGRPDHTITTSLGESELAASLKITFLSPNYIVDWKFNSSTKKYDRYQGDELQRDTSGKKIKADTLIIQRVKSLVIDEIGRKKINTVGSGEAMVFYDGQKIDGIWKKENRNDRTRFYDAIGEEIKLKPGKIWVEVVGGDSVVLNNPSPS